MSALNAVLTQEIERLKGKLQAAEAALERAREALRKADHFAHQVETEGWHYTEGEHMCSDAKRIQKDIAAAPPAPAAEQAAERGKCEDCNKTGASACPERGGQHCDCVPFGFDLTRKVVNGICQRCAKLAAPAGEKGV